MHRTVDSQRNRNAQCQDRSEYIDEDRCFQRLVHDLNNILLEILGISEIAFQQSVEFPFHIGDQPHPACITDQYMIIQSHLFAQILIHLLIRLRCK